MPFDLTTDQVCFFVILIVAFALLLTEKLRNDLVALLIVISLYVTGVLSAEKAVSGFSSEPPLVVAAIFVLSAALHATGVSDTIGRWIGRLAGTGYARSVAVIMTGVALLSAFTHHLTTTAIMLPVTMNLSRERQIAPSKLLMPLSFAASLGTTITIIGAPAFLIASGVLQGAGRPGLGIFSIAPIGIALSLAGTAFMLLFGRFLLPERQGSEDTGNRFRLDDYFTEIRVGGDSRFREKTVAEVEADPGYTLSVVGWLRDGRRMRARDLALRDGDVLLVRTTPEQLIAIRQESGMELHPVDQYGAETEGHADDEEIGDKFVQAVVAPDGDLVGRSIAEIDFRQRYGAIVLSLWRQNGWLQQELSRIRLRGGDVLVLQGDPEALARLETDRAILMITPFHAHEQVRRKAPLAALIMFATVVGAAHNVMMAAIAGAVAMVLTRCITGRQAYRAIDARIFVFIAGAIPLGTAMKDSGASQLVGDRLKDVIGGWNQFVVLLILFWLVAVITQFMSDAATTALFAPVAVALAGALGQNPEPYVVTVAMAAVAAFLTPIGHHGNLLIYAPGGYKFADFVRVGVPLTILVGFIVAFMAPIVF